MRCDGSTLLKTKICMSCGGRVVLVVMVFVQFSHFVAFFEFFLDSWIELELNLPACQWPARHLEIKSGLDNRGANKTRTCWMASSHFHRS